MITAFEITDDDIRQAVEVNTGINISDAVCDSIMHTIDHDYVERAALRGGTFVADQMDCALDAIWEEVEANFARDELEG